MIDDVPICPECGRPISEKPAGPRGLYHIACVERWRAMAFPTGQGPTFPWEDDNSPIQ